MSEVAPHIHVIFKRSIRAEDVMYCKCMIFECPCVLPGLASVITAHKTSLKLHSDSPVFLGCFGNTLEHTYHNADFPFHNDCLPRVHHDFSEALTVFLFLYLKHMA